MRIEDSNGQATQCAKPSLFRVIAMKDLAFWTRSTECFEAGLEEQRTEDGEVINPSSRPGCSASLSAPAWQLNHPRALESALAFFTLAFSERQAPALAAWPAEKVGAALKSRVFPQHASWM